MMDHTHFTLIAAGLRSRSVWEAFDASGEAENAGEELAPFAEAVRSYYEKDPSAESVDPGLLDVLVVQKIRDPKRREMAADILRRLVAAAPSVENAKAAAHAVRVRRVGEKLATALLVPSQKDGAETVPVLLEEYSGLLVEPDEVPEDKAWSRDVIAPALGAPRIPIWPRVIADRIRGGLWPGHHMTIFARPEMGKTALMTTIAVRAVAHSDARVLYLTNEDPVRDLMVRCLAQFSGLSPDEAIKELDGAIAKARKHGADRLLFRDMAPGSLPEIGRMVRKHKPDLLIVDQMRNMGTGQKAENMTQRLDSVAQGLRNIGKRYGCSVISVTQAGDSARDKAILDDGDVDSSNTGVSAGCDVLIGMGATPAMMDAGERRLSFIKNKLGGKHGFADVRLNPVTLAIRDN